MPAVQGQGGGAVRAVLHASVNGSTARAATCAPISILGTELNTLKLTIV